MQTATQGQMFRRPALLCAAIALHLILALPTTTARADCEHLDVFQAPGGVRPVKSIGYVKVWLAPTADERLIKDPVIARYLIEVRGDTEANGWTDITIRVNGPHEKDTPIVHLAVEGRPPESVVESGRDTFKRIMAIYLPIDVKKISLASETNCIERTLPPPNFPPHRQRQRPFIPLNAGKKET
jgi:hypothetical protein